MKLNKYHKEAFVAAVLQDVPQIDYTEQIRALVSADNLANLPAKVKEVAQDAKLKSYLETATYHVRGNRRCNSIGVTIYTDDQWNHNYKPKADVLKQVEELVAKRDAQQETEDQLRNQLTNAINAVSTLKQALDALPEFAKYLPTEIVRGKYLPPAPIIANLVADLNAAGWPKGEKPAEPVKRGRGRPRKVEVAV